MSTKLKRADPKDRINEKIFEEKYENIKLLFTVSFVITDSIMVFDLVSNIVLTRSVEEYFYLRFLVSLFGLYGTLIIIGGNYCREYWECEFTCCCGKFCENLYSLCGCHVFFGGLLLTASYCIELCSIKIYYENKDKFEEELIVWLLYLLFIFSSITIIMLCFLIVNMKTEKKIKHKFD